jgi:DNA-binding NtrC family response regulator
MLNGLSVLIVEDELVIALDLAATIEDLGGFVIGPFATVAEAMMILEQRKAAAAILDANLLDRDITPVAVHLTQQGVPFVVHTGTGLPDELKAIHPALPVVLKPAPVIQVVRALIGRMETTADSAEDPGKMTIQLQQARPGRGAA